MLAHVTVSESFELLKAATVHFGGCLETSYLFHIHLFICYNHCVILNFLDLLLNFGIEVS
jgi:hypothetical protein